MADNVPITAGVGTNIATDDMGAYGHVQRMKMQAGGDGTSVDYLHNATRSDTFTGTGNGTSFNVSAQGLKSFSMMVKGTGSSPTSWTVNLQVSLDGSNWTTILTHSNTGEVPMIDGQYFSTGAAYFPALFFRSNVNALVLGPASNVVVTICGK